MDMGIKILRIFLVSIMLLLLLQGSQCNKKGSTPCVFGSYSFSVTSEWSPQQEIYKVGDTIFLSSTFPKSLNDQIDTSLVINYSNSTGVVGDLGIFYLDSLTHKPVPAKDSFSFFSNIGKFVERPFNQRNGGINIFYRETADSYSFNGQIICNSKGIYTFTISDLFSRGINGRNCTKAGFIMHLLNSERNLHLHEYTLNISANEPSLQKNVYDFRVE